MIANETTGNLGIHRNLVFPSRGRSGSGVCGNPVMARAEERVCAPHDDSLARGDGRRFGSDRGGIPDSKCSVDVEIQHCGIRGNSSSRLDESAADLLRDPRAEMSGGRDM